MNLISLRRKYLKNTLEITKFIYGIHLQIILIG